MKSRGGKRTVRYSAAACAAVFAMALFAYRGTIVEEYYLYKLRTGEEDERREAAEKLASMRSSRAIPALLETLRGFNDPLLEFVDSPIRHAGRSVPAARSPSDYPLHFTAKALVRIGPHAIPHLVEVLREEKEQARFQAAKALAEFGPQSEAAVTHLVQLLSDKNDVIRSQVRRTLASIGRAAVPDLIGVLEDADREDRRKLCAIWTIQTMGRDGRAAVDALVPLLRSEDADVRIGVVYALASVGQGSAVTLWAIEQMLQDPSSYVRGEAVEALGAVGDPAIPAIIRATEHPDAVVRWNAAATLGNRGPKAGSAVPALLHLLADETDQVSAEHPNGLVYFSPDKPVRAMAAEALGKIGAASRPAVPHLMKLLGDEHTSVRRSAKEALAKIEQTDAR